LVGTPNESRIGDRLRAARERLGWSREELAVHSGVSWSAIAQVESGRRRNLRPRTLSRLCGALGVSIDYLVNGGPTPPILTHQALLYETDEEFAERGARFLLEGLERSEASLAITNEANIALLGERMGSDAAGVQMLESEEHYRTPEVMLGLFRDFLETSLEQGSHWVRILGEPIWTGRTAKEVRHWTRYESMVNLILADSPTSVLCPYDLRTVNPAIVADAHTTHPELYSGGALEESRDFRDPALVALEA
jgi:transcriptional regulator with XRE-family HTH domain